MGGGGEGAPPRLSLHVISRAQCKFSHMFNMCTYCYDNELQGKTIFHILGEGEGGKTEPSLGLPLHLTSGFDCAGSLTLSAFMIYLASHIGFIVPSSFLSLPLLPSFSSAFTHPAIAGCQSINKQLTSDSFSIFATLALALAPPTSFSPPFPLLLSTLCAYLSIQM